MTRFFKVTTPGFKACFHPFINSISLGEFFLAKSQFPHLYRRILLLRSVLLSRVTIITGAVVRIQCEDTRQGLGPRSGMQQINAQETLGVISEALLLEDAVCRKRSCSALLWTCKTSICPDCSLCCNILL